ncbi:MAG TPA: BTAD domain-containing putative transcriptional regulator [Jatrophihabitans sp.]|nr:BTAD domain-containing putative transcriptional regulator [Jatrophihabitans sp.]
MLVALLGPLEVTVDGDPRRVSGPRLRTLLLRLAIEPGRPVSGGELAHAVWGAEPPADQANALQTLVSRLRRALGVPSCVQPAGTGYQLHTDTDVRLFRDRLAQAQAAAAGQDLARAAVEYADALAVWRGAALAEVAEADWAQPVLARLEADRLAALRARIECDLHLGRAAEVIPELQQLVLAEPTREELTETLMAALVAAGRPADGLLAYEQLRRVLAEELGVDPSPRLRERHQRLLSLTDASEQRPQPQRRTNLRSARSSFIGRDDEQKRLSGLLDQGRLATVVGPGGAGKTRLAGVVAAHWLDRMADGVWLVELAPVTDPANIELAILSSLGMVADPLLERGAELTRKPTVDKLQDALLDAECLLVLDNCEHLIGRAAAIVDRLLDSCPGLKVLATSREPLGIDGEALCMLAPLELPAPSAGPADALSLPSVRLFADRAMAVSAGFRVDDATVRPVIEIVRRLDGLPLAIELAAARLRGLPVAEIADRLSDRFRLLTGGSRIAMPRHRTLRAVVEWSWELLTDAERLLAERLAIFASGACVASAQAICADPRLAAEDVLDVLMALVDKSLLTLQEGRPARYQMLETIREFGLERLAEQGELAELRLRHARYFSALAQRHCQGLRGPGQLAHLRGLEDERENIQAALAYLCDAGEPHEPIDLAYALCWYWMMIGRHSEATRWLQLVLDATRAVDSPRRVLVQTMQQLNQMATTFGSLHGQDEAEVRAQLRIRYQQLAQVDPQDEPMVPLIRAILTFFGGVPDDSIAALAPAIASPDRWVRAAGLMFRANMWENFGEPERMLEDAQASLRLFTELDDRWGMASASSALGQLRMLDGDIPAAIELFGRAGEYLIEFGAGPDATMLQLRLADLHLRLGDVQSARAHVALSQQGDFQIGGRAQRLIIDTTLATIALTDGDLAEVARLEAKLSAEIDPAPAGRRIINSHMMAVVLATKVNLMVQLGRADAAEPWLHRAYADGLNTHDMPITAQVGLAVARWAAAIGEPTAAAEIWGATARLRGAPDPTEPLGTVLVAQLDEQLGTEAYRRAFERGQALPREQALIRLDPATVRAG